MSERPLVLPFDPSGIALDRRRGLSQQLYQALRARVLDGRLSSGTRLPATREPGHHAGVVTQQRGTGL